MVYPEYDRERTSEHVRHRIAVLAKLRYDHDGNGSLPLRIDVRGYIQHGLFRVGGGLIPAAGFPPPGVTMGRDGTVTIAFESAGRRLNFCVPCMPVVVMERCESDGSGYIEFTLDSEEDPAGFDDEVERGLVWLRGGRS